MADTLFLGNLDERVDRRMLYEIGCQVRLFFFLFSHLAPGGAVPSPVCDSHNPLPLCGLVPFGIAAIPLRPSRPRTHRTFFNATAGRHGRAREFELQGLWLCAVRLARVVRVCP